MIEDRKSTGSTGFGYCLLSAKCESNTLYSAWREAFYWVYNVTLCVIVMYSRAKRLSYISMLRFLSAKSKSENRANRSILNSSQLLLLSCGSYMAVGDGALNFFVVHTYFRVKRLPSCSRYTI